MRARFLLFLMLGCVTNIVNAQTGDLVVMGVSPGLYLTHTVAPKENWYSVGRLYNISPKEIAPFNGVTIDKALSIGEEIKIPLTASNFSQNGTRGSDEISVPVYHIIQEKEWMYRISTNYNKVPIENIEKWNGITKDQAKTGMKIIIGYLNVKRDQSALASRGVSTVKVPSSQKGNPPATTIATAPQAFASPATIPEIKAEPPIVKQEATQDKQLPPSSSPVEEKPAAAGNPVVQPAVSNTSNTSGGAGPGYFKTLFEASGKSVSGAAGVFKSTSGWQDGKYYALMNNVAVGTIVKVSNPTNNKTIYAKVLGQLPDMKESIGLTARLSDAAASELGTTASRFSVEVTY